MAVNTARMEAQQEVGFVVKEGGASEEAFEWKPSKKPECVLMRSRVDAWRGMLWGG